MKHFKLTLALLIIAIISGIALIVNKNKQNTFIPENQNKYIVAIMWLTLGAALALVYADKK